MGGQAAKSATELLGLKLDQAPVFSHLDSARRSEVARLAVPKELLKGEFVFHQGEMWPFVLSVVSGKLEWSLLSPGGRRQALHDPGPGDFVWGHTFFDDQPMPGTLEALEPSTIVQWDRDTLRPILSSSTAALWDLTRVLVASMRRVREIVYGLAFHSVPGRLARLLLMHYPFEEGVAIRRSMTLEEMAAHVGSTPALVCKTLYEFADQGLLRVTRSHLELLDRAGLCRVAEDGEP